MRYVVERFIPRGSVILAVTTFGSYALGLFRDRIFAQTFGASTALDSYNAAFLVPDFIFNVLVASGIAAAVVPIFTQLRQKNAAQATTYLNAIIAAATVTMVVTGLLVIIMAPLVSQLVAPGLDDSGRALVVRLMRVLALSPILFGASNALGAMLVAQKRFLFYGLSPLLYNVGIIGGTLLLAPQYGIIGTAFGTLIGAGLHMAVRIIDGIRSGWRWQLAHKVPKEELKKTIRLMLPKMIGHPVELLTFWVFTSIASLLSIGSISVLNFARNFQSVPVSLLGITMATAIFPALAEVAGSPKRLRELFHRTAGTIIVISTIAAIIMFLIRRPLVAILLGGGAFDSADIARTAATLGVFCLAIPTESLSHLFARAFYATQNTSIPVTFSIASLLIASTTAYLLSISFGLGIIGLPLGFFLGSLTKAAGLFVVFKWRTR